jgi:hypothetical protein
MVQQPAQSASVAGGVLDDAFAVVAQQRDLMFGSGGPGDRQVGLP